MRKRICIISFSPIHRDARVLRQVEYLSPHYDLVVIGYGPPVEGYANVEWRPVAVRSNALTRVMGLLWLVLGRILPRFYDFWYWQKPHHKAALRHAEESKCDAYHANDWNTLPVAAKAAKRHGAKLVLDAHEYAPLEFENSRGWRALYAPLVKNVLTKYQAQLDGSMTVSPLIAERYGQEFNFGPIVVLNAPKLVDVPLHDIDANNVSLVYHGGASPDRRLEKMIEALAKSDRRFTLHFILVEGASSYVLGLKDLAHRVAPDRITFHEPVPPAGIVTRIAEYDVGFYMLEPSSYNNRVALPNKFFDFIAAGLAVCVGPSTGMAEMVTEHGFGGVAPTFDPSDVAYMLNQLTGEDLVNMRRAARETARQFNAEAEMAKMVQFYEDMLSVKP